MAYIFSRLGCVKCYALVCWQLFETCGNHLKTDHLKTLNCNTTKDKVLLKPWTTGSFFFSFFKIWFSKVVHYKPNISVWNWSTAMYIWLALWILMAWCLGTRVSVATVLSTHPYVPSHLQFNLIMPSDTIWSVGNSHRSTGPRPTTLEEDWKLFVDFSSILYLWFEIEGMRTYNFFDSVSNTGHMALQNLDHHCSK